MQVKSTALLFLPVALAAAVLLVPGSEAPLGAASAGPLFTGADGPKVFASGETVVDLAAEGTYDPARYGWAVVFDWTSLHVPGDAVVRFSNHPSGAPVIWHSLGDVLIDGQVLLDGEDGRRFDEPTGYAEPGPGGFRGGRSAYYAPSGSSAGLGPGGGFQDEDAVGQGGHDRGGSFGTLGAASDANRGAPGRIYGGSEVFPLVGGSGGAGGAAGGTLIPGGGGAGGGAICIAAVGAVQISSGARLSCNGGAGGYAAGEGASFQNSTNHGGQGSGGAIRIVGDSVSIQGAVLEARGTQFNNYGASLGGDGRIRIESNWLNDPSNLQVDAQISPEPSYGDQVSEVVPQLVRRLQIVAYDPDPLDAPGGWIDIAPITDPLDSGGGPRAQLFPPSAADVLLPSSGALALRLQAQNVPAGRVVIVRITDGRGQATETVSPPLVDVGLGFTEAEVQVDLDGGVSAIQLRVDLDA